MTNPKYLINIYYQKPFRTGSTGASVNGEWVTAGAYSGGWYVANMPEVRVTATGSSYANALTALLSAVANVDDAAQGPFLV